MPRIDHRLFCLSSLLIGLAPASQAVPPHVQIVTTARAGAVDGTRQNSDEFIWRQLTQVAAPVARLAAYPSTLPGLIFVIKRVSRN
ncbi:hypothetical protein [Massilia sp. S19_KUP03_FR1]|uniref:hypothetical protein n=1 Tax=Massilia sp. S19_KUP03_FR1 TaxID=3025503 RepID=UPI002FCD3CCB